MAWANEFIHPYERSTLLRPPSYKGSYLPFFNNKNMRLWSISQRNARGCEYLVDDVVDDVLPKRMEKHEFQKIIITLLEMKGKSPTDTMDQECICFLDMQAKNNFHQKI